MIIHLPSDQLVQLYQWLLGHQWPPENRQELDFILYHCSQDCLHPSQCFAYSYSWETVETSETSVTFLTPLSLLSSCSLLPLWSLRALKSNAG